MNEFLLGRSFDSAPKSLNWFTGSSGNDTAAIGAWLSSGSDLYAPEGIYTIAASGSASGGVFATIKKSTRITCHPNAIFRAGNNLDRTMITMTCDSASYSDSRIINVEWNGGQFDQTGQKNSTSIPYWSSYPGANPGSSSITDGLDIRGSVNVGGTDKPGFTNVKIRDIDFRAGNHWLTAGGDSGVFIEGAKWTSVRGCTGIGYRDALVYLSGIRSGTSKHIAGEIVGCKATNCIVGFKASRAFDRTNISQNIGINCPILILHDDITTPALGGTVSNNIAYQSWVAIFVQRSEGLMITGNESYQHGALDNVGAVLSLNPFRSNSALVWLTGATHCVISNNSVVKRSAPHIAANSTTVLCRLDKSGTTKSRYNWINNNNAHGIARIALEDPAGADFNQYTNNRGSGLSSSPVHLVGVNSTNHDA